MREGWSTNKLVEIAEVSTGKWDANHANPKGEYRFYTCAYDHAYCNTNRFSGESLILPGNGVNVGEVFYYDGEFDAYQRTYVINNIHVLPRYLYYHMQLHWKELGTKKQYGSATNFIKIGNFQEYNVEYPTSETEQQRIVETLDEMFASIDQAKANVEKNLSNARQLFQSKLHHIFNQESHAWEQKRLQEISLEFGRGKSKHRPRNDEKLFGGAYPFIQTGDVRNANKLISSYSQTYNEAGLAQSKLWPKATICITIAANIAETAILSFDSCFPDSMIGLVVDPQKADVDFTYYVLQYFKSELQMLGKGSAQDNINLGTFENQLFPFPSIKLQSEIAHVLNALSAETKRLESSYQRKLNELEDLKKSILQKAFTGELIPKPTELIA